MFLEPRGRAAGLSGEPLLCDVMHEKGCGDFGKSHGWVKSVAIVGVTLGQTAIAAK
jgi:hypothetical protein